MSSIEQLELELVQTKARAFDVLVEAQEIKQGYQHQRHILCILAHKLGFTDMNSLNIENLPSMLDEKLRALYELEQSQNQKD